MQIKRHLVNTSAMICCLCLYARANYMHNLRAVNSAIFARYKSLIQTLDRAPVYRLKWMAKVEQVLRCMTKQMVSCLALARQQSTGCGCLCRLSLSLAQLPLQPVNLRELSLNRLKSK